MEVCLDTGHIVLDVDPAPPPIKRAHVCCGQTARWIKMPLGREIGFGPGDIVRWGSNSPKRAQQPPLFGPCLLWPNGWTDQDAIWYGRRPQPRPHCVRWGPAKRGAQHPQFSVHVCRGQTVGWTKMPLGREVCLGRRPGHIVLDVVTPPPKKGTTSNFGPVVAKRLH